MDPAARYAVQISGGDPGDSTYWLRRAIALGGLSVSAAVLSIAVWTTPDPRGLGTHEQLGLPPCLSVMLWGVPCPTCGMCTAFAHAVRGDFPAAFHAQPAGLMLAVATIVASIACAYVLITGRAVPFTRVRSGKVAIVGIAMLAAGWAYKAVVMYLTR